MKPRISRILNVRIALVIISVNICVGMIYYALTLQQAEAEFNQRIELQTKHLVDTFTQQLWLFDLNSAQQLTDLTLDASDIIGLRLLDHERTPLIEKGNFSNESMESLQRELLYDGVTLVGYLEIAYFDSGWQKQQETVFLASVSMMLTMIVLTFFMVSILLKKHLTKPLNELQQDMNSLASGGFEISGLEPKTFEIHSIISVFNQMASSLAEREAQRDLAENELNRANAILQAAMDCSPAGIAIANVPDGSLRYVNDAGLMIRGEDKKNLVNGIDIDKYVASWQLFDLDGTPLATDEVPLARAILYGERCSREFIIRRSDEDDRIVFANAAPILDKAGIAIAAIVIFLDTTERKSAEDELRRHKEELDELVEERTEKLRSTLNLMTGREVRMSELKKTIVRLKTQLVEAGITPEVDDNFGDPSGKSVST